MRWIVLMDSSAWRLARIPERGGKPMLLLPTPRRRGLQTRADVTTRAPMTPSLPRFLVAAAMAVLLETNAGAADEPVTLNFVNADIEAVVKAVAEMTGRNFVLDPR